MRTRPIFASTSFRLAALNAVILSLAVGAIAAVTWFATRDAARTELRDRVVAESDSLNEIFRDHGALALIQAIETRSERAAALDYGLVDASGRVRANELPAQREGWSEIQMAEDDEDERQDDTESLLVRTIRLADGSFLSVGMDLSLAARTGDAILLTLMMVSILGLAISLSASIWLTRRALHPIDALTATSRAVTAGDLSARVPATGGDGDLAQLCNAFNGMLDRIEALVASVRQVSTDVAHDLRTPLAHVRQQLEQALDSRLDGDARKGAIEAADASLVDVLRTFEAILRLAELDASPRSRQSGAVDLAEISERVADAFRPDIEAGRRTLTLDLERAPAEADRDLVAQMIANLIENSMRHTPAESRITLRTSASASGNARLEVSDDGPGVPERERDSVLQRFYRLEQSRSGPGAGIGLSLVAAIARWHGAQLTLDDAKPGLLVSIVFPIPGERGRLNSGSNGENARLLQS